MSTNFVRRWVAGDYLLGAGVGFGLVVLLVAAVLGFGKPQTALALAMPSASANVLDATTYPAITLTSASNTSLFMTVTPQSFDGTNWTYQINWKRTRAAQGSLFVTIKSDLTKSTNLFMADPGDQTGSGQIAGLNPSTAYRVEFYQDPGKGGVLLLRKFFTTLPAIAVIPCGSGFVQLSDGTCVHIDPIPTSTVSGINIISPAGGEQWPTGLTQNIIWSAPASTTAVNISLNTYISCLHDLKFPCAMMQLAPQLIASNVPNNGLYPWAPSQVGQYTISVSDSANSAIEGESQPFSVTSTSTSGTTPIISNLSPSSGPVGTHVIITGSNFTPTGNYVVANSMGIASNIGSVDGTTLSFTVPAGAGAYCPNGAFMACPQYYMLLNPQNYSLSVINSHGQSNQSDFLVTDPSGTASSSPVTKTVSLGSLSPESGSPGTLVTINGSGFSFTSNTIALSLASAAATNFPYLISGVNSPDGKRVFFNIPQSSGPTCTGKLCPLYPTSLGLPAGVYNLNVTDANGITSSNSLTLTITDSPAVQLNGGGVCVNGVCPQ